MLTVRFKQMGLKPGDRILDLGCGEGRHCHGAHMIGGVHVFGVDLDPASLVKARDGLDFLPERDESDDAVTSFLCASAYEIPFADNSFDAIVCSEVLEHLDLYPEAIKEMRRVLKPDGKLAVTVPHGWPERVCWRLAPPPNGYPFEPGGHIRIFDDLHLKTEIALHGFQHTKKHHAHGIHSPYWWLKCLFWERRDDHPLIRAYHQFLVWDIMKRPWLSRAIDALVSPFMGKSVALYFEAKPK